MYGSKGDPGVGSREYDPLDPAPESAPEPEPGKPGTER